MLIKWDTSSLHSVLLAVMALRCLPPTKIRIWARKSESTLFPSLWDCLPSHPLPTFQYVNGTLHTSSSPHATSQMCLSQLLTYRDTDVLLTQRKFDGVPHTAFWFTCLLGKYISSLNASLRDICSLIRFTTFNLVSRHFTPQSHLVVTLNLHQLWILTQLRYSPTMNDLCPS